MMNEEYIKRLDFDSDTFEAMKTDMNFILQRMIGSMIEKDSTEGSMTIKIDVNMVTEWTPNNNPDVEGETRMIRKPQFKHKCASTIKINDEKSGSFNNEMELDMIGDQRTALFIVISDTDDTFNFVVAMMYSQLFNLLCDRADDVHHGRLPYHVRILCDEFANIGQIPKFDKLIATIRSREISASIILQSQSQLKTIYKDAAETITGNCDTMLFLGGKESTTLKEISETLGKETIDLYNTSDTRGQSRSYGLNYQKTGKELMSRDELAVMDGNKCILQLRGVRPFYSDKFDITKHKRYKQLSDYDKKNEFHVEEYMKHQMEVRLDPEEQFDLYMYESSELEEQSNSENEGTEHVT